MVSQYAKLTFIISRAANDTGVSHSLNPILFSFRLMSQPKTTISTRIRQSDLSFRFCRFQKRLSLSHKSSVALHLELRLQVVMTSPDMWSKKQWWHTAPIFPRVAGRRGHLQTALTRFMTYYALPVHALAKL